jgi:hypothetical protein
MARYVQSKGKIWPRTFFEPPINPAPGACSRCGGTGQLVESIDSERYDVTVPCFACRRYCKACDKYVKKTGHECKGAQL